MKGFPLIANTQRDSILAQETRPDDTLPRHRTMALTSRRPRRHLLRALVIEDQVQTRHALRRIIEAMGHDVDEATNRHDGLAMLIDDSDIGIVVLDLGLPPCEHDSSEGLAFLSTLAQHHHRAKVIVLTGHRAESIATQCIAHGAFDHIVKPFTSAQIRQSVQRADLFYRADNISATSSRVSVMVTADAASESAIRRFHEQPMEKLVRTVLTQTGHNVSEAARRLRVRRANLYYYINKFGITRPDNS